MREKDWKLSHFGALKTIFLPSNGAIIILINNQYQSFADQTRKSGAHFYAFLTNWLIQQNDTKHIITCTYSFAPRSFIIICRLIKQHQ